MMDNIEFYRNLYKEHGNNIKALGWGSNHSQIIRFKQLLEAGLYKDAQFYPKPTILDIGCGFGDLRKYFHKLYLNVDYYGIDLNKHMIQECQKRYPTIRNNFIHTDLFNTEGIYDWVFASGVFALEREDWIDFVTRSIEKMFDLTKQHLVVNFLFGKSVNSDMHFTNLSEIDTIMKVIDKPFILKQNYHKHDITLII